MVPLQWTQLIKTVQAAWLGLEFVFFELRDLPVCFCVFYLTLDQLGYFPSCFGVGVTNLNEPYSSSLLPPHYCRLGAGSNPLRAIVNKKQCETRGLFMSLVIHY